jgi:AbrB family looped-hinge helix DNA binding protein
VTSAKITSQGQITIPKAVREALGVVAGDRIAFRIREDGSVLVEAETVDLLDLRGSVTTGVRGVSVDDMNAAIRKRTTSR